MQNNYQRIKAARAALKAFKAITKDSPDTLESDITDLVTDLLHLANRHSINPQTIADRALGHYLDEHGAREIAARKHGRSIKNVIPLYNQEGEQIREVSQDEIDWTH